ncbi:hypothetical protein K440DRAFT_224194 [Wilcoxina mikolae CBS 423.85]|nr:hypothetical protein K440DRAFT_224194 [Wilcoxina mikolae CBS 423.85]
MDQYCKIISAAAGSVMTELLGVSIRRQSDFWKDHCHSPWPNHFATVLVLCLGYIRVRHIYVFGSRFFDTRGPAEECSSLANSSALYGTVQIFTIGRCQVEPPAPNITSVSSPSPSQFIEHKHHVTQRGSIDASQPGSWSEPSGSGSSK